MTVAQLEKRVEALEKTVNELQARIAQAPKEKPVHWWRDEAGRFANDPIFDEIVRLGREYRRSQVPDYMKKKKSRKKKHARS